MNKEYLKWLRILSKEYLFIEFGNGDFRAARQYFLKGEAPDYAAFMFVPW
jgi:hypothetical protein